MQSQEEVADSSKSAGCVVRDVQVVTKSCEESWAEAKVDANVLMAKGLVVNGVCVFICCVRMEQVI